MLDLQIQFILQKFNIINSRHLPPYPPAPLPIPRPAGCRPCYAESEQGRGPTALEGDSGAMEPACTMSCPAHAHACPLHRPPESVWAQPALDQLNGSSPILQFLHVILFLFLLLGCVKTEKAT